MKRYRTIIILSLGILALSACEHEPVEPKEEEKDTTINNPTPKDPNACDPNRVYFKNDILPLIQGSCAITGCHDNITAKKGLILTSFQGIMNASLFDDNNFVDTEFFDRVTETDPGKIMPPPPSTPLSAAEIQKVRDWFDQGMRNDSCTADCDTNNFAFSTAVFPIIQTYCSGCHTGGSRPGGIAITDYAEVRAIALSGQLLGTIRHESGYSPMPKNQAKLSDCKITQIRKWVENGSPND